LLVLLLYRLNSFLCCGLLTVTQTATPLKVWLHIYLTN